ncbi:hypothetical protein BpHYR1_016748 [Brachionus plicatilis]|uniref:Uncharacterized protein n=1 Tax=Brachionus plicatilis TaxID=10195 RepID=A0A3M7Q1X3_BRAPC|nr:hypothetical protein BpHYR1_016748 [Brachionus plicatilis]
MFYINFLNTSLLVMDSIKRISFGHMNVKSSSRKPRVEGFKLKREENLANHKIVKDWSRQDKALNRGNFSIRFYQLLAIKIILNTGHLTLDVLMLYNCT